MISKSLTPLGGHRSWLNRTTKSGPNIGPSSLTKQEGIPLIAPELTFYQPCQRTLSFLVYSFEKLTKENFTIKLTKKRFLGRETMDVQRKKKQQHFDSQRFESLLKDRPV